MADEVYMEMERKGYEATLQFFTNLKGLIRHPKLIEAMKKWSELVERDLQMTLPIKSGALMKTVNKQIFESSTEVVAKVLVGKTGEKTAAVAWWLEKGTKAHWVEPKKASALHWVDPATGEDRFSKGHVVSGIKARRYARDAFTRRRAEGVTLVKNAVLEIIREAPR